jgi:hypothetical protein
MTRLLSSLAARTHRCALRLHYGRAYIFLVVALTVFLVGLAFWRQPVSGYTARIGLVHRQLAGPGAGAAPVDQAKIEAQLRAEILSPQAWRDWGQAAKFSGTADELAALQQRTTVHVHTKPTGETHIALWHAGASEEQALAVAQQLAERFATKHSQQHQSRRRCQQCDEARAEVARATAEMQQAKEAVESFRLRHAAELSPPPASDRQAASSTAAEAAAQPSTAGETVNPQWQSRSDRLDVLRAAHARLLEQRTPEHPEVVDLAWQIQQVEADLAKTPRLLETPNTPAVEATTVATSAAPSAEVLDQLRKLTAVADAAERRHGEALTAERRAWQQRWSQPSEQVSIVEPAQIVQRHGGGPSKGSVLLISLVAIVCGGVAAWRSQLVEQPAVLVSAAQLEAMGLSVVATLSSRDGPAIPQPQLSNPLWIRYLTLGCELSLAAIVALLVVVVLSDWHIAAQAIWDPLSAFSDAIWRLTP